MSRTTAETSKIWSPLTTPSLKSSKNASFILFPPRGFASYGGSLAQGCGQGHSPPSSRPLPPRRTSMPDLIETVEDGVAILTLNRPENLNALSEEIGRARRETTQRLGVWCS